MRIFNTTGPVRCAEHYCLPPLERMDLDEIMFLIEQKKYFVLHAPRQVGKTTYLLALMDYLNQADNYHCLYINVEVGQAARENVQQAMQAIVGELDNRAKDLLPGIFPAIEWPELCAQKGANLALNTALTNWAKVSHKPIILLIDELDTLIGDTLISVLRQLRAGYDKRPTAFPQSVVLCGLRDVRDYRLHTDKTKAGVTRGSGSPFNIKAKSLRLGDFKEHEVKTLYQQHTQDTGQVFEEGAVALVWALTQGQPWLVNALGYEVCFEMKANRDRSQAITRAMIDTAKERLIQRRETHLDQLVDKLKEGRVRRVIVPILSGTSEPEKMHEDDIWYTRDLGLIKTEGHLRIANKIYQEIIPRALTFTTQVLITHETTWYVNEAGQLDIHKLLHTFQQFFRENAEHWVKRFDYQEAGPQLLMQAFLQRVINSGGRIEREYGLGRGRTDLLIIWPHADGVQRVVIELRIRYGELEKTINAGLEQTWQYMDTCGAEDGNLVIFDRDEHKPWKEKIFVREAHYVGHLIKVWGM